MRELIWSKTFIRAVQRACKKNPHLRTEIKATLRLLQKDPFAPQLASHKLKGKLSGTWACSAGYDLRILFDFVKREGGGEEDVFLLQVGTHEEVY